VNFSMLAWTQGEGSAAGAVAERLDGTARALALPDPAPSPALRAANDSSILCPHAGVTEAPATKHETCPQVPCGAPVRVTPVFNAYARLLAEGCAASQTAAAPRLQRLSLSGHNPERAIADRIAASDIHRWLVWSPASAAPGALHEIL
jgi:hypothetical protein